MPAHAAKLRETGGLMADKISEAKLNGDNQASKERSGERNRLWRVGMAFALAGVSDLLSVWLEMLPPMQWLLDGVTAGLLFLILGRQWMILPGLIAEAIPGLALFPSWLLVVGSISAWGKVRSRRVNQTLKPESPMRKSPN